MVVWSARRGIIRSGEPSGRSGVGILDIVEVGQVEFIPESVPAMEVLTAGPGSRDPGQWEQNRSSTSKGARKSAFKFDEKSVVLL